MLNSGVSRGSCCDANIPNKFSVRFYDFYPSAIKAVGYSDSDHLRWVGGRAGLRPEMQLLLKSLLMNLVYFFKDMTYVPGQFISYIFLAPSHKRPFSKMAA